MYGRGCMALFKARRLGGCVGLVVMWRRAFQEARIMLKGRKGGQAGAWFTVVDRKED